MGEKFKITHEMMVKADTYIPVATKELIASTVARACVKPTCMIHGYDEKDEAYYNGEWGLTPVYCESASSKARIMMTVLCVYYLHAWGDDSKLMCSPEEYDAMASAHILNQIERYKSGEFREKAFDLLSDYREMEKYMNSAIYAVLREMNDSPKRIMEALGNTATPEGLAQTLESIKVTEEAIEQENERQEAIIHGREDGGNEPDQ